MIGESGVPHSPKTDYFVNDRYTFCLVNMYSDLLSMMGFQSGLGSDLVIGQFPPT